MPTQGLAPCEHNMYGFTDRAATTYGFMSAYWLGPTTYYGPRYGTLHS